MQLASSVGMLGGLDVVVETTGYGVGVVNE